MRKITEENPYDRARQGMVDALIAEGISDHAVLAAMARVPRHAFLPENVRNQAYDPHPVHFGHGQTISSPFIVASMTAELGLRPGDRVLEIGTGCGYQTAILCSMGALVWSIEILPDVAAFGAANLEAAGFNANLKVGDGFDGWPQEAPFDACLAAATAPSIPATWIAQLKNGGRLVMPLKDGRGGEVMIRAVAGAGQATLERLYPVVFVPMTGKITW
jgi:protein-L-isoaspartate(D-aspartate) O-methyltransferase